MARDDAAEVGVARDLEPHPARAADVVHDGQQRDRGGRGVAGQDALIEAAATQHVGAPALARLGGERLLGRQHGDRGGGARASEELPSRRHHGSSEHADPANGAVLTLK
jgi:hypothetical protein